MAPGDRSGYYRSSPGKAGMSRAFRPSTTFSSTPAIVPILEANDRTHAVMIALKRGFLEM
jgi:hypothetical protein